MKPRYSYTIRVRHYDGSIKFAYPRATFPAAIRAYELEIAQHGKPTMYSVPTRATGKQGVVAGYNYVEFERVLRLSLR